MNPTHTGTVKCSECPYGAPYGGEYGTRNDAVAKVLLHKFEHEDDEDLQ